MLQILDLCAGLFEHEIGKNLQHDFPKMRRGSKDVWNFSKNSSVLVASPLPLWKVLMDEYFHYHGSLTTGTCDEAVNWMVFKVIVTIGKFLSDFPRIWELAPQFCCFVCLQNITRNTQAVSKFCSRFLVDMQANARSFLCILKIFCQS